MAEQANELTARWYRCRRDERLFDTFYDTFLSKSPPDGPDLFAKTDFKIQKLVLRQSLLEMLCFDRGMSGTREEIERLGRRHKALCVTPEMYTMWLDSLCEAVKMHDPSYTIALEQLWRDAMLKSIKEMVAVSAPPRDRPRLNWATICSAYGFFFNQGVTSTAIASNSAAVFPVA